MEGGDQVSTNLPNFYTVTNPKARKEHKCCECRGVIQKGERYQNYAGHWNDSGFGEFKTCSDCEQLRDDFSVGTCSGEWPAFGDLSSDCSDAGDEWLDRMVSIKIKRGAKVADWMLERLNEAKEANK